AVSAPVQEKAPLITMTIEPEPPRDVLKADFRSAAVPHDARGEPIEILLIEDSPDDANLTVDVLREGRIHNRVTVIEDGVEAMSYLRREGRHSSAPRPDLILL